MKKIGKPLVIRIEQEESPSTDRLRDSLKQPLHPVTLPDSDQDHLKAQVPLNLNNIVEFQQFLVQDQKQKANSKRLTDSYYKPCHDVSVNSGKISGKSLSKQPRQFSIQIPEGKGSRRKDQDTTAQNFKQPPAPSNKKSVVQRSFIFPETHQHTITLKNQSHKKDNQYQIELIIKGFDKERQEFYREKSKFQKELLVKEGQIEMLQKMLTGRLGSEGWSIEQRSNRELQAILLEKDLQISQLLQKISQLTSQLSQRGQQLHHTKIQLGRLQNVNETLLNQLYVLQKKDLNCKKTQQFYEVKRQKCSSPTQRGWQSSVHRKQDYIYSGVQELQKRLQNLHNNRKQLQQREKIKSEMSYSQSSKYKSNSTYQTRTFANFPRKI